MLAYAFATTPDSSHSWILFRMMQWEVLRASAGLDTPTMVDLSPFSFPPGAANMGISMSIIEIWKNLDPAAIFEWEELTRDIKSAYAQLVYRFGNGIIFDGNAWEDQRYYHARSLFFKWMGYQLMHTATPSNNLATMYIPTSLDPVVSI
ncbi:hypothetical protein CPB86DRAFT_791629 [Serendipita vermifera]|nr:hypothetical protein CPB86DRAFT_791629 [Serendipita vermifera]